MSGLAFGTGGGGAFDASDSDSDSPLAMEREILSGMFPKEFSVLGGGARNVFRIVVRPRRQDNGSSGSGGGSGAGGGKSGAAGGEDAGVFARVTMDLTLDADTYPETPPSVSFSRVVGLSDAQLADLCAQLDAEAAALAGDFVCASLVAVAADFVTAANVPPRCAICLEQVDPDAAPHVVTDPCVHFFHATCLSQWWLRCALAQATGIRGAACADLAATRADLVRLDGDLAAAEAALQTHTTAARKNARRVEILAQQRASLRKEGAGVTLSERERVDLAELDARMSGMQDALDTAKKGKKESKQRADRLRYRAGEARELLAKLEAGVGAVPSLVFEFGCPVCRTGVSKAQLVPHLPDFGQDQWWETVGCSGSGRGGGGGGGGSGSDGSADAESPKLDGEALAYTRRVQQEHARLLRQQKARRGGAGVGTGGGGDGDNSDGEGGIHAEHKRTEKNAGSNPKNKIKKKRKKKKKN